MKRTWIVEVKLSVEDFWIADGFDVTKETLETIQDMLAHLLPYAYGHEFKINAKVVTKPAPTVIERLQGGSR